MISRIQQAIARLLTPWRTIRQLESEVEGLEGVIANPYLAGVQIGQKTGLEVEMQGSGPQLLAGMFEGLLEKDGADAPNYLELQFQTRHQGQILVHVQRLHGESPHALRLQAEQRADAWQDIAEQLVAAAELVLDTACAGDIDSADFQHRGALNAAIGFHRALVRMGSSPTPEAGQLTDGPDVPQGREPASVNGQSTAAEPQP